MNTIKYQTPATNKRFNPALKENPLKTSITLETAAKMSADLQREGKNGCEAAREILNKHIVLKRRPKGGNGSSDFQSPASLAACVSFVRNKKSKRSNGGPKEAGGEIQYTPPRSELNLRESLRGIIALAIPEATKLDVIAALLR